MIKNMEGISMRRYDLGKRIISALISVAMVLALTACGGDSGKKSALNPDDPVTVTIWSYYNGEQLAAFENLIEKFNSTVGVEKGIVAVSVSQGDIGVLADTLLKAVEGEAGAENVPTLASVYAETAYILNEKNAIVDLEQYFTKKELSAYVEGFIEEGRFNDKNELLTFPIIKSTESFSVNKTDWEPFAEDTGITIESVQTQEDLVKAAEAYYKWTDDKTPDVPEDGKALYGRDSVGNYIFLGAYQLGNDMFPVEDGKLAVELDRDTFKTLWDNYYVPYINGYFGAYAKFRSEDAKTGKILALTSSTASAGYLPTEVTDSDDTTHSISIHIGKTLPFANAKSNVFMQQGANYCLLKSSEAEQEGAVELLKWMTESNRNMEFAVESGYSPVTVNANDQESIRKTCSKYEKSASDELVLKSLLISAECFDENETYSTKPFKGSKDVRTALEDGMEKRAIEDRAIVEAAIKEGASREEAVAPYVTDEYFDAWFANIKKQVELLTK